MDRSNKNTEEATADGALYALAQRLAVAGGSLVALLSLFHHTRVSTAALRGGLAWLVVLAIARLGRAALKKSLELDAADQPQTLFGALSEAKSESE